MVAEKLDKLDFDQFLTCLIRIAHKCYPSCISKEDAMQQFLMDNVLPLASKRKPVNINRSFLKLPQIEALFKYYEDALRTLYDFYGTTSDQIAKEKNIILAAHNRTARTFDDQKGLIEEAR